MLDIEIDVDQTIIGVVRRLAAYSATGDMCEMSRIRSEVTKLAISHMELAMPLWNITLHIQRALSDIGPDEEDNQ